MTPKSPQTMMSDYQHEINDARAQLRNLDENNGQFEVRKMVLEHGLASLEAQYKAAERARHDREDQDEDQLNTGVENGYSSLPIIGDQRPRTSDAVIGSANAGFSSYAGDHPDSFGGHFASDGVVAAQGRPPQWSFGKIENAPTNSDTVALPATGGHPVYGSTSSPESEFLRPPKRQRDSLGLSNDSVGNAHKSMRTTPSPAITATTSPTSMSSFDFPDSEDPDLLTKLLGGNPGQDLRDMREEQREQERALEARRQQERADEEFARQLMEQDSDLFFTDNSSRPQSSTAGAASRNTSQNFLDNQGRFRPSANHLYSSSPVSLKAEDFSAAPSLPVKQERSHSNYTPIKNERSHQPKHNHSSSRGFIDLENDDLLNQQLAGVAGHPSSDIVELDPVAFGGNNRGPAQSSINPRLNSHDGSVNTGSSSWGLPSLSGGQLGQTVYNAAGNMFNGAYDLLDQQLGSYGSVPTGFGGTSAYQSNNIGPSPEVIDLESYDQDPWLAQNVFNRHGINLQDPANQDLVSSYMDRVEYVANDPTRTTAEIKSLLENIRPDEELPPENREGTPEAMTYPLMEHQKLGLTWMKSMEEGSTKGGILADDMGLGKTIQALALIVSRRSSDSRCKTTLIVCPVALLKQWGSEIESKVRIQHKLKVYTLHQEKRHVDWAKLRSYDVVLTTFGTLGTEVKRREGIEMNKKVNPNWRPSGKADYLPLLGDECQWYRIIIDEAQCIKNKNTKAALGAALLQAKTRFCMTGTPMMNNVSELYSLVHFLRIKPYCEAEKFSRDFTRPLKGNSESAKDKAMRQLQALLKAILLRRTKKSQIDGKPILNLPERTTEICHSPFSEDEAAFYAALESRTQLQFNKFLKAGTVGRNYSNILVLLLRLRQACCHPHLIKDHAQASFATDVTPEDMRKMARELAPEVVNRIKEQSGLNDDAALECPVCMDFADNATIFIPCGHNTCSECFARISDPSQAIADGNADGRGEAKCPNCRGKITPTNVIDHNIFKQVYMPELLGNGDLNDPEADIDTTDDSDSEDSDSDSDSEDEDIDSKGNLKDFIVDDGDMVDDASDTDDGNENRSDETPFERSAQKEKKKVSKGKGKGKGKAKELKAPRKTLAQLKKEGMRNAKAKKRYLKRITKDWIPSAKTDKVMEILRTIRERKDPDTKQCEKTIIFSQFTSLMDLLEIPIVTEGWDYRRYDGSMTAGARNDAVQDFMHKKECKIMLVSLKAGNAGLNLTVASQVIILDPFWNPFVEEQAIDRAHRIGQQNPVQVHRILVPNTVEDRIIALQEKKRELIEGALDEKASQSIGRLGTRELGFLFDVRT